MENITYLKHVIEIFQHEASSLQEFLDFALDKAIDLTKSRIGYIYHYDESKKEFTLNTWSKDVMKECSVANPQTVYSLERTGIWGEAVRQRKAIILNDFQSPHPLKKGYPEGHAKLYRFMTVPVFNRGNIAAVVGVANKDSNYDETDVLQLTLMMDAVWKIVDQKKSEYDLKQSEEKYRQLAENMTDVVWTSDLNAKLTFISPSIERLTGETVEENMMKSFEERFSLSSLQKILPMFQEEFEKEKDPECDRNRSRIIEAEQLKKDGSIVYVSMNIKFIRDSEGKPVGFFGVTRDITEKRKAEIEKENLQKQLMQSHKMESIGRLAGGIAHDFNNMLTVIIGRAELAMHKTGPVNPLYKELNEIKNAAERSATLTAQLLTFARKQLIAPKLISLNESVKAVYDILKRLLGEKLLFDWLYDEDLWKIRIDPSQVDQIMINLCLNAKEASKPGGRILVETRNVSVSNPDHIKNPGLISGDFVRLSVSDNGTGIDKETMEHLFEPFFTTKEIGRGSAGLGLAAIYGIVKQNKGYIYVESRPGEGTRFDIYFPRQEGE